MEKQIIIEKHPYRTRAVLIEDSEIVEYIVQTKDERLIGNIYKGKVLNVLPGMNAAFVDIGLAKNAFLQLDDMPGNDSDTDYDGIMPRPTVRNTLRPGQELMVQVQKENTRSKGARVTPDITIAGRCVVLMPTVNIVGISRRIENKIQRSRLLDIAKRIKHPDMGLIIRTSADGEEEAVLKAETEFLICKWHEILNKYKHAPAASAVWIEDNLAQTAVRDLFSNEVTLIALNDKDAYEEVLEVLAQIAPGSKDRVQLVDTRLIFDHFNIENTLEKLLSRKIWLKNGSYIVIDHTEAMTVIDVNTGKFTGDSDPLSTALNTNILAAREIARQLRLRNIGGIVIVDFIYMDNPVLRERILDELNKELRKDRVKTSVLGMTALGLVEITRKKVYKSVMDATRCVCTRCGGTGSVMDGIDVCMKIRRELIRIYEHIDIRDVLVEVDNDLLQAVIKSSLLKDELKTTLRDMRIYIKNIASENNDPFKVTKLINTDIPEKIKDAITINN